MQLIAENTYVEEILSKFFKPIKKQYYEDHLNYYLQNYQMIQHSQHIINNRHNQKIVTSLFKHSNTVNNICIVYLHGFGSNQFQALNIINVLPKSYSLCSFDFSGSGRSEGDLVTYGNKQKYDIQAILIFLRKLGYQRFVLWGRSMGATASILYTALEKPSDVILQILDSPFCTFQTIAIELAHKKINLPGFAMGVLLSLTKQHCAKFQYNPFQIDAKDIQFSSVPCLFVYSKNDSVVKCQNSQQIIKHCKTRYEKLIIEENHNTVRKIQTLQKIFLFIQKYKNLHFKSILRPKSMNKRKGINIITQKNVDNYGIWVSMKFKNDLSPKVNLKKSGFRKSYLHPSLKSQAHLKNGSIHNLIQKKYNRLLSHDKYL